MSLPRTPWDPPMISSPRALALRPTLATWARSRSRLRGVATSAAQVLRAAGGDGEKVGVAFKIRR